MVIKLEKMERRARDLVRAGASVNRSHSVFKMHSVPVTKTNEKLLICMVL
jgi:hypothetical protein